MKTTVPVLTAIILALICAFIAFGKGIGIPPDMPESVMGMLAVTLTLACLTLILVFRETLESNAFKYRAFLISTLLLSITALLVYSFTFSNLVVCSGSLPEGENCVCFSLYSDPELDKLTGEAGSKSQTLDLFGIDYIREKIHAKNEGKGFLVTEILFISLYSMCMASIASFILLILLKFRKPVKSGAEEEADTVKKISKLISSDRLDLAFPQIKNSTFIAGDEVLYQEIILLESRYQKNKRDNNLGTLSQQEYSLELNKIKKALLDFVISKNQA